MTELFFDPETVAAWDRYSAAAIRLRELHDRRAAKAEAFPAAAEAVRAFDAFSAAIGRHDGRRRVREAADKQTGQPT